MPTESHYDKPNKMIYHRYWGSMTGDEFLNSLSGESEFFDQMTGPVGVIFDLSELKDLPPSILTLARNARFARYKPLEVALVRANAFVRVMGNIFSQITRTPLYNFNTLEEATDYLNTQIKQPRA